MFNPKALSRSQCTHKCKHYTGWRLLGLCFAQGLRQNVLSAQQTPVDTQHETLVNRLDVTCRSRLHPTRRAVALLNAFHDPTRELYEEINPLFVRLGAKTGQNIRSTNRTADPETARSVIDRRLPADDHWHWLYDIDEIARRAKNSGRLAVAPAEQFLALHLDHRVPGAQGHSQGDQGLGDL
jgi:hypothetical protein